MIPLRFDEAQTFGEGKALATLDGKTGIIDLDGQWLVPPRYPGYMLGTFRAGVLVGSSGSKPWGGDFSFIMNARGEIIHRFPADIHPDEFSDSLIRADTDAKRWTFFRPDGKPAFNVDFDYAWSFQHGLCLVVKGKRRYIINTRGEEVADVTEFTASKRLQTGFFNLHSNVHYDSCLGQPAATAMSSGPRM